MSVIGSYHLDGHGQAVTDDCHTDESSWKPCALITGDEMPRAWMEEATSMEEKEMKYRKDFTTSSDTAV